MFFYFLFPFKIKQVYMYLLKWVKLLLVVCSCSLFMVNLWIQKSQTISCTCCSGLWESQLFNFCRWGVILQVSCCVGGFLFTQMSQEEDLCLPSSLFSLFPLMSVSSLCFCCPNFEGRLQRSRSVGSPILIVCHFL